MLSSTKSLLMLLAMLLLGVVLGMAGMVVWHSGRFSPPPDERSGGFVVHMLETIEPRDAAQRAEIAAQLETIDQLNRLAVDQSRRAMRANLDSMAVLLAPLLDAEQQARLGTLVRSLDRPPPRRGGPPPR